MDTVSDLEGLAAVQLQVGDNPFVDVTFGDGTWHTAQWLDPDPEDKTYLVTVRAIDLAGQVTEVSRSIPVDLSTDHPPDTTITVTPPDPSLGNTSSFSFTGVGGENGLAGFACRLDDGHFTPCGSPWSYDNPSDGSHTFQVRATDSQGFVDPTPASLTWLMDANPPAITINTPPDGAVYLLNAQVTADYSCDDGEGSGVASCTGPVASGAQIDTASVGLKTFTVDTSDLVSHTGSATHTYYVIYDFVGFSDPAVNPPAINAAKASQTAPLLWRITDANGAPVTDLTSVTVTAEELACDAGTTPSQMEEYGAGGSGLQNLGDGHYQFNWRTPKSYANSCKTLKLDLSECPGMERTALFLFEK